MKSDAGIDVASVELDEFSAMVWGELSARPPSGVGASRLAGAGFALIGMVATSLTLYLIYRGIGGALIGSSGPIPSLVWLAAGAGLLLGAVLIAIGAIENRPLLSASRWPTQGAGSAVGANGHDAPRERASHTA